MNGAEHWRKVKRRVYSIADEDPKGAGPRLNLGCGADVRPIHDGWVNIDKYPAHPDVRKWDVEVGYLPFEDDTFGYVLAIDFMEHIPHRSPTQERDGELFALVVADLIRVSRHGAIWLIMTPARAMSLSGAGHCRLVHEGTWDAWRYRDRSSGEDRYHQRYGTLRLLSVSNIRQWTPNVHFGRAVEKVQRLGVVKR